jgi:hypothetical protein
MTFYRIKEHRIYRSGKKGAGSVYISGTTLKDLQATVGDVLSLYRGTINGIQVMVVANIDAPELRVEA